MIAWKQHPTFKSLMISTSGEVYQLGYHYTTKRGHTKRVKPYMRVKTLGANGYYVVNVGGKRRYVHRLVAQTFLDNIGKDVVNHKDGNKLNNCYWNLEWCTLAENNQHGFKHGLLKTPVSYRRFTKEDVAEIMLMHERGMSFRAIGRRLGASHNSISDVVNKKGAYR